MWNLLHIIFRYWQDFQICISVPLREKSTVQALHEALFNPTENRKQVPQPPISKSISPYSVAPSFSKRIFFFVQKLIITT